MQFPEDIDAWHEQLATFPGLLAAVSGNHTFSTYEAKERRPFLATGCAHWRQRTATAGAAAWADQARATFPMPMILDAVVWLQRDRRRNGQDTVVPMPAPPRTQKHEGWQGLSPVYAKTHVRAHEVAGLEEYARKLCTQAERAGVPRSRLDVARATLIDPSSRLRLPTYIATRLRRIHGQPRT